MKKPESGSALVEFALALPIFLMFMLGVLDFSRMLFTWNAANEATRAGARYAVVCDDTVVAIVARVPESPDPVSDVVAVDVAGTVV